MTAASGSAAVANANKYTSYDVGMCLKWVRSPCWQIGSLYGSAIDAWYGAKYKHPGDRNPPKGAPMFYSGGKYGHIVIANGEPGGRMRSTDCASTGKVSAADLNWPVSSWGDTYLGWTEDLNGVRLPIGGTTPTPEDDDMPQYDHASAQKAQKVAADQWVGISWTNVASGSAFKAGSTTAKLGGRQYSAVVHADFTAPQGSTIRVRCVEVSDGKTDETNPQTEFVATGGTSYPLHAQIGYVSEGRAWGVRVSCSQRATLNSADVTVLSW